MHESVLKFIRDYWFLILFIGGIVMGWSTFQSRITVLEGRISKVEVKQDADSAAIASINTQLAQIQTTLEFIKQQIANK